MQGRLQSSLWSVPILQMGRLSLSEGEKLVLYPSGI